VIGCCVDGIASTLVTSLVACVSDRGEYTGDTSYANQVADYCSIFSSDCNCVSDQNTGCFFYNGGIASSSCNNILEKYTNTLHASIAFDLMATFGVFALSIVACVSVCCPYVGGGPSPVLTPLAPAVVNNNMHQPQYVQTQYAQPQYANAPPQQAYGAPVAGYPYGQPQPQVAYGNGPPMAQGTVISSKY
jgi:hypothetical protein